MDKGVTVNELAMMCMQQLERGNGDKHILISDDDEGNGYHTLFYGITDDPDAIVMVLPLEHDNHTADEVVVLG